MRLFVLFVAVSVSLVGLAQSQTFRRTHMLDTTGKIIIVDLTFDEQTRHLTVQQHKRKLADVPYDAIDKLSYAQASHRRAKEGAGAMGAGCVGTAAVFITCPASVGVGAVTMMTKGKDHWFYVDYKLGTFSKDLAFKLSKREYEQVLKTAKAQTGKDVEVLAPPNGNAPGKK